MARKIIIWLSYLDPTLPRRLGRRIPRNLLPGRVTIEDLLRACQKLGLECEVLEDKLYPRTWYLGHKGISVTYDGPKSELLRKLAKAISDLAMNLNAF